MSWWWWWEIAPILLSIMCTFAMVIVLARIEDTPLDDWKFSIQLNSLIAILTTTSKAAMLVAVTTAIGQLKWLHFTARRDHLLNFQRFDDASRGP